MLVSICVCMVFLQLAACGNKTAVYRQPVQDTDTQNPVLNEADPLQEGSCIWVNKNNIDDYP